jgi:hypothetical protein
LRTLVEAYTRIRMMAAQPEFSQIAQSLGQRRQEPRRLSTSKTRGQLRIESPTPMGNIRNTLRAENLPWGSRKQHARPLSLPPLKSRHIPTASKPYTNFSLERELGRRPRTASSQSDSESMKARMSVSPTVGSLIDLDALSVKVCPPAFHIEEHPCTRINICQDVDETGKNKNETQRARTYMSPSKLYLHL